jgi:hypothetical protein
MRWKRVSRIAVVGLLVGVVIAVPAVLALNGSPVYSGCLQTNTGVFYGFQEGPQPLRECRTGDQVVSLTGGELVAEFATLAGEVAQLRNVAALSLDGNDDYAWTPDPNGANNLDGFSGLTIAAWINPDTLSMPQGSRIIVSKYHSASPINSISYWLLQRGDEVEVFVARQRVVDEDRLTSAGVDLVAGEWVHVAGTWDGASLKLFVNGFEVASQVTSVAEMDDSAVQVNIGSAEAFASGSRSAFFSGALDEVYIFDGALTQGEIAVLAGLP